MRRSLGTALGLALAAGVGAQRAGDASFCDHYTKALLNENTAQNQATLVTVLVNTAFVGNYTLPNVGVRVPGILTPGRVDGVYVDLLPYFNGGLKSTNTGKGRGEAVSFLDSSVDALRRNLPANDASSRQYFLFHHMYSFFGSLLGCSMQGGPSFGLYDGRASMYQVHKYMGLSSAEVRYFIEQVGLAAASFGVARGDIEAVTRGLDGVFNVRCARPAVVVAAQGRQLQSVCVDAESCRPAPGAACGPYERPSRPERADGPPLEVPGTEFGPGPAPSRPEYGGGAAGRRAGLGAVAAAVAAAVTVGLL